jgi:asparagine synthetase B (glutamine-hydrolysing)
MFLFCVTRQSVATQLDSLNVREFVMNEWVVTVATDEWLSTCSADTAGVHLREMPPFGRNEFDHSRQATGHGFANENGARPSDELLFAEARFIAADRRVEIARTLLGGRAVYHHAAPRGDFFCATHIGLLKAAGVTLQEDAGEMAELFIYRYITAPRTLFEGIDQLLAGQSVCFEFDGHLWRRIAARHYSPPLVDKTIPASAHAERTLDALERAMLQLKPAGKQLHLLLSGGIDSSILFMLARKNLAVSDTYSSGYPFLHEEQNVEKHYALSAAHALGAQHHHHVPDVYRLSRAAIEVVDIGEEPVIFPQSLLFHLLFRDGLPAERATVAVGQGADGLFGLRLHHAIGNADCFRRHHPLVAGIMYPLLRSPAARPLLSTPPFAGAVRRGISRLLHDTRSVDLLTSARWGAGADLSDARHVLWRLGVTGLEDWTLERFGASRNDVIANRLAAMKPYADLGTLDAVSMVDYLSDVSVSQATWSKLGEAARKVVYYPFNARGVIDCALAAPWEAKLAEPKAILRDVARKLGVPGFILDRPKANFNITSQNWSAPGGVFEPLVAIAATVWDAQELRRIQTRPRSAFAFWTMVNYAIWKRLFIGGEPASTLLAELDDAAARLPAYRGVNRAAS